MSPNDLDQLDVRPELLWILADDWTLRVVKYLQTTEHERIPLQDLVDQVAGESDESVPDTTHKVELRLHHSSLPRLDQDGLIEYDWESRVVRNNPEKQLPEDLLDHLPIFDDD